MSHAVVFEPSRYSLGDYGEDGPQMVSDPSGEWIRYEDHVTRLDAQQTSFHLAGHAARARVAELESVVAAQGIALADAERVEAEARDALLPSALRVAELEARIREVASTAAPTAAARLAHDDALAALDTPGVRKLIRLLSAASEIADAQGYPHQITPTQRAALELIGGES